MVQLQFLSGKKAGTVAVANRFPWTVGRLAASDFRLEDPGVWERHLVFNLRFPDGFILNVQPDALAAVNGQRVQEVLLRNGDLIEIGPIKILFWLSETRQMSLRAREILTWLSLGLLSLGQVGLIYWLLRWP